MLTWVLNTPLIFEDSYKVYVYFDFNMAEAHTCITEERLQILIKNIFAEEFQKQKKKLLIL